MAETAQYFSLTIVTPAGTMVEYEVRHLKAPGSEGDFGILANHLPLVTSLRLGEIEIDTRKGVQHWAVVSGFVEVLANKVTILAENAEPADKIDVERAKAARDRAIARLQSPPPDMDFERCRLALQRSLNRLKVAAHKT